MLPKKIKVGFDVSQTGKKKAGCGYFAYALLKAIQSYTETLDWYLFPHFGDFFYDAFMPLKNPFKLGKYGPRLLTHFQAINFWNDINLQEKINHIDILHSNNFWCPSQLKNTRLIYTLYDLGFFDNYRWTTEQNRIGCFDGVLKASLYADGILTISEFSKKQFLNFFPYYPADRIEVIYPCSRFPSQIIQSKPKRFSSLINKQFWLTVGTIEPRKNLKFLAEIYAEYLKSNNPKFPLVIAGQKGWLMHDFESYLIQLGIEKNVILLGYVNDEELMWLYQNCFVNLYPSVFEGFGLPVLEALQFGAPSLTTQNTAMDEIIYSEGRLKANNKKNWLNNMIRFHEHPGHRSELQKKGYENIKKFTWNQSAEQTLNFYEKVMKLPKLHQSS